MDTSFEAFSYKVEQKSGEEGRSKKGWGNAFL